MHEAGECTRYAALATETRRCLSRGTIQLPPNLPVSTNRTEACMRWQMRLCYFRLSQRVEKSINPGDRELRRPCRIGTSSRVLYPGSPLSLVTRYGVKVRVRAGVSSSPRRTNRNLGCAHTYLRRRYLRRVSSSIRLSTSFQLDKAIH